jgi:hypothetical protein
MVGSILTFETKNLNFCKFVLLDPKIPLSG